MERELKSLKHRVWTLREPGSYWIGQLTAGLHLPDNVLAFSRQTLSQGHEYASQHSRFVLITNLATPGELYLNDRLLHLGEGEALLIFPHQLHHYLTLGVELCWLYITFDCAEPAHYLPLRYQPVRLSTRAWTLFDWLLAECEGRQDARTIVLNLGLLLESLLDDCQIAVPRREETEPAAGHSMVLERVNRFVYAHMQSPIQVSDLALEVGLSPSRLRAVMRQGMGVSPGRYIRRVKLNWAARQLSEGLLDVTEVADRCGFGSIQAFSRAFREHLGLSPTAYRLQCRSRR